MKSYIPSIDYAPVTLAETKLFLRVDHEFEDSVITALILSVTGYAEQVLNREIVYRSDSEAVSVVYGGVPASIKNFVLMGVADLFRNREPTERNLGQLKYFHHLLDAFVLYDRTDELNTSTSTESGESA